MKTTTKRKRRVGPRRKTRGGWLAVKVECNKWEHEYPDETFLICLHRDDGSLVAENTTPDYVMFYSKDGKHTGYTVQDHQLL